MKIIKIGSVAEYITVDSTFYTADNTILTADVTYIGIGDPEFKLMILPREYPTKVYVDLYNEVKQSHFKFEADTTVELNYLTFLVNTLEMKEGDSFELFVRKDSQEGELIYRAKAFATYNNDLQNYKMNYPNSNGVYKL